MQTENKAFITVGYGYKAFGQISQDTSKLLTIGDEKNYGLYLPAYQIASVDYELKEIHTHMKLLHDSANKASVQYVQHNLNQGRVQFVSDDFLNDNSMKFKEKYVYAELVIPFDKKNGKPQRQSSYVRIESNLYFVPQLLYLKNLTDQNLIEEKSLFNPNDPYLIIHDFAFLPDPIKLNLIKEIDF